MRSPPSRRTRRRACCSSPGRAAASAPGRTWRDRAVAPGGAPVDLGESIEKNYRPLVLGAARPADAGGVRGQRRGRRRGRQHRARLRHRRSPRSPRASSRRSAEIGLVPDSGGTYFLPRLVGTARAMGLAMLGDKLSAEQAAAVGPHLEMRRRRELDATVDALLAQLAQAPDARAGGHQARAARRGARHARARSSTSSATCSASSGSSADYREGVAAFLAKRPPQFTGPLTWPHALPFRRHEVAVIGAGAMGAGIAQIAAQAGHRVHLFDNRMGAADAAKARHRRRLREARGQGQAATTEADAASAAHRGRARAGRPRERAARGRGDRRGPRGQAQALPRARGGRRRRRAILATQHLVAVDHRARRRDEASAAASSACTSSTRRRSCRWSRW